MFDKANSMGGLADMLYGKSVDAKTKFKNKCLYIEGMVRFLELYAANEIGNYEVDITKVALWVNSPQFENIDCYNIHGIFGVFKSIEKDIINNIPMYRFLKLPNSVLSILEREHRAQVASDFEESCKQTPCLGCMFFSTSSTDFGALRSCSLERYTSNRGGCFNPNYHRKCKYVSCAYDELPATVVELRDSINRKSPRRIREFDEMVDYRRKKTIDFLNHLDNSLIPVKIPESLDVDIAHEEGDVMDFATDLGRVFSDRKGFSEMRANLRNAMFIEAMVRFVDIYAQTEVGSDYIADVSKIAKYIWKNGARHFKFKSSEECYEIIENMVLDGFDVGKFIKRNYTF